MRGEKKERWLRLCEQASVEQDPQKLLELVQKINRMFEAEQSELDPPEGEDET